MISLAQHKAGFLLCSLALACGKAEPQRLPALGEVVVSIDTDAPVPDFVGRLRIDLYGEDGSWLESRDIARTNPTDWPASFSLFTRDEMSSRRVLVRARGYLEGRTRDYKGERFQDRAPFVEPPVATTLGELCAAMPQLVLGQELTLRRGRTTLTSYVPEQPPATATFGWTPECCHTVIGGAVAARLDIAEAGEYRIETTRVRPASNGGGDVNLFIRTSCSDPASQIACADDLLPGKTTQFYGDYLSRIVTWLAPGSYTVMASGHYAVPADITLRAAPSAYWDQPAAAVETAVKGEPRLITSGTDTTPAEEPQPLVAIDRLALVTLVPGQKQLASIVLRTACAGHMAKLSNAASDAQPVLAEAETCIDEEGELLPLRDEVLSPFAEMPTATLAGTFAIGTPCPAVAASSDPLCMPPGMFVMGDPSGARPLTSSTVPERFAVMNRFWLDKTEVTVSRFRAAVARGFQSPSGSPFQNEQWLAVSDSQGLMRQCTYSAAPSPGGEFREEFPVNCVDWDTARAFCKFEGGDLPTEAQWQYAATKAGRDFETRFPWGDQSEAPRCDQAVFARQDPEVATFAGMICAEEGYGPAPVTYPAAQRDATVLGVLGLGGNLQEWSLDGFYAYDSPCWRGVSLIDPQCREENAPERAILGGSWYWDPTALAGATRGSLDPVGSVESLVAIGAAEVGFRCAYANEPP
jgi:formylglycine-generating enzyme required for sulfatase activity